MDRPIFLDTGVLIAAVVETSRAARRLVFASGWELHTIDYAIKEVRRVLRERYGLVESEIAEAVDHVRSRVAVHKTPPAVRFKKLDIRDRSDKPIV